MVDSVSTTTSRKVLNVGGNSHEIAIPAIYAGWKHHLLDIDPVGKPDIVCDARKLTTLPAAQYDAIYCSHNLEHYHYHDVDRVLQGFVHLLKPDGFAHIRVPDLMAVMEQMQQRDLDIADVLYHTGSGQPITVMDVLYGWGRQIEQSGVDFYAHKTGFSQKLLVKRLQENGFPWVAVASADLELKAFAFRHKPSAAVSKWLSIPLVG